MDSKLSTFDRSTVLVHEHESNGQLVAENAELKRRLDQYERSQDLRRENERLRAALAEHGDPAHAARAPPARPADSDDLWSAEPSTPPAAAPPSTTIVAAPAGAKSSSSDGGGANLSVTVGRVPKSGGEAALLATLRPSSPAELHPLQHALGLLPSPAIAAGTALVCCTISLLQLEPLADEGMPAYEKGERLRQLLEHEYGKGSPEWGYGLRLERLRAAIDTTAGELRVMMVVDGVRTGAADQIATDAGLGFLWTAIQIATAAAPETHLGLEFAQKLTEMLQGKEPVAATFGCRVTAAATLFDMTGAERAGGGGGGQVGLRGAAARAVAAELLSGLNLGLMLRSLHGRVSAAGNLGRLVGLSERQVELLEQTLSESGESAGRRARRLILTGAAALPRP